MPKGEAEINYDLILEAAKMLRDGKKGPEITSQLHISSRDVAVARELMNMNVIMFDDKGEPYYTMHEVELEPLIRELRKAKARRKLPPVTQSPEMEALTLQRQGVARASIDATVEDRISRRAVEMTEATYRLGDAVRMHYDFQFPLLGSQEARPELIIPVVFEKAKKYDRLEERVEELERLVYELQRMTDPLYRLERCLDIVADFAVARGICKKTLGVDIAKTSVGDFYADMIVAYLTGAVEGNPTEGEGR
jgi:hypothetical protein